MSHLPEFRSLAAKFSIFTALVVLWVTVILVTYHLARRSFVYESLLVGVVVMMVAVLVAQITSRLLVRPIEILNDAMTSVGEGRLETIRLSHTRDEIEMLGHSFNRMIAALIASREEVRKHQEHLEERIRQRTEDLHEAMLKAQQASQAKSEFLANMSHELRTPMNGLLGMLEIVLDGRLSLDQREQLETAQTCANALLMLLNDILDLSKIEAGKMSLEKIPFDLRSTVGEVVRPLQVKAREKRLELSTEVAPSVPGTVLGDPLRIRQILFNLLGNAVKFTERGWVKLAVGAGPSTHPGQIELRLDVSDTGPGIPAGKLELIFENFTQADGSITRKHGGTGLGLSIARRLAEMQGGRLWVESEAGQGATFHVALEVGEIEQLPGQASLPPAPGSKRILLVEDNVVNQKLVTVTLRKRGYDVALARNGLEALEVLERSEFDLVLMDLQMPLLDGVEATRRIRANHRFKSLPIVALTADTMASERERAIQAGMNVISPSRCKRPNCCAL